MKKGTSVANVTSPITFMALSDIPNPLTLLKNPGDEFKMKVNKNKSLTAKLNTDGIKRSATYYPKSRKVVDTISH